ncbi:hypothetical protein SCUP234_11186 [Seiridium cupressi]
MKLSKASLHAVCGATAVSALSLPQTDATPTDIPNPFKLDEFGWFNTISLDDAKSGIIKFHNGTLSKIAEEVADDLSDVATAIASGLHLVPGGSKSGDVSDEKTASKVNTVSTAAATCSDPNVRFEWRSYSDTDRHAFVAAFQCLIKAPASGNFPPAANRYEDLVRVHQMMTDTIHGNNIFLYWHRYYVWTLEQIMREECGFDRAFPWWDETLDAGAFAASSIFTADFFGSLPAATADNQGTCITDGGFANTVCHIGPGTSSTDHCLSRAVNETLTAQCNADFVNTCNSRTAYPDMENCAELGPHAFGHNGVGSVMADVSSSPEDPVFFLHHLFIDRNFWVWQNADASRTTNTTGCIDNNDPCTALTMDTVITVQGLRPDVTVKDIINTVDGTMCYQYTY